MATHELRIIKRIVQVQGRSKPMCEVKAIIPATEAKLLVENFGNEPLFRRTAYPNGFGDCGYDIHPSLARMLANFVRNDACPEVLVKTLVNGQRFEANTIWDVLCFEFCVKLGFDALVELCQGIRELDETIIYRGKGTEAANLDTFAADAARERLALAS